MENFDHNKNIIAVSIETSYGSIEIMHKDIYYKELGEDFYAIQIPFCDEFADKYKQLNKNMKNNIDNLMFKNDLEYKLTRKAISIITLLNKVVHPKAKFVAYPFDYTYDDHMQIPSLIFSVIENKFVSIEYNHNTDNSHEFLEIDISSLNLNFDKKPILNMDDKKLEELKVVMVKQLVGLDPAIQNDILSHLINNTFLERENIIRQSKAEVESLESANIELVSIITENKTYHEKS